MMRLPSAAVRYVELCRILDALVDTLPRYRIKVIDNVRTVEDRNHSVLS